ncbi:glucose-6-phosphate isomerase [Dongia sp.]|uniref:glucose-6-phosphate isomerase n=1 Tax=Dongia sp. TaxID=1977262 RepID=UPI0035B16747
MALFEPTACQVDVAAGTMSGATGTYRKRLADLAGLYGDEGAFAAAVQAGGNTIVYDVADFRPSARSGDLIFGITRMSAGCIGEEYYMTRGHIHAVADRPEIYYGQAGQGLMLMESPEGEMRVIEMRAQTICYVPPFWIHRSVNTGTADFVMIFSYPADSGQDYGIIERAGGMRHRVMQGGPKGWQLVGNKDYRPRSTEAVAAVMQP